MADESFIYDEDPKALTANGFVMEGHRFIGWVTSSDSRDIVFTDSECISNAVSSGVLMLYACWESIYYSITEDGILSLTQDGRDTLSGEIVIPDYVNGIAVTALTDHIFAYQTSLSRVTIPSSVTSIGNYAFFGCQDLSVIIAEGATSISDWAFANCSGIISISIPDSVISIGNLSFWNCTGLTSIIIPDSVVSIGSAFSGCTGLTDVTISEGVESIGASAFSGCTGLTSITIPNSVTSIGSSAFAGCKGLTSIIIPNTVVNMESGVFSGCEDLSIILEAGITSIQDSMFYGCGSAITNITIPDSVVNIGRQAFSGCAGLTSMLIPDSVTSIGADAFHGCTNLTSITIPNSVTSIGSGAFADCTSLTDITFPDSVTDIGANVFAGCINLDVTFAEGSTRIVNGAMHCCSGLISVTIPESVTSIGSYAFSACPGLTSISIPDSVVSIDRDAFNGCTGLTSITIPNGITRICEYTFNGCSSLQSISIPSSVSVISTDALAGCINLETIQFSGTKTQWDAISKGSGWNFNIPSYCIVECIDGEILAKTTYVVGENGPSGGYIFYDCDSDNDSGNADGLISTECGWRYLEAAPGDIRVIEGVPAVNGTGSFTFVFGYNRESAEGSNLFVNGTNSYGALDCTGTIVGTGKENTRLLVDVHGDDAYSSSSGTTMTSYYAAKLCDLLTYTVHGITYDDWFLPSKDELNLLYSRLQASGIGGFDYVGYWSSSESSSNVNNAWVQYFDNGGQGSSGRNVTYRVRPIRSF